MKFNHSALNKILTDRDKKVLLLLLTFSIFVSVVEGIGVSIMMPFISTASDFSIIETNKYYSSVYRYFEFDSPVDFVVIFGLLLVVFYIFKSVVNLYYTYVLERFSLGKYHVIASKLLKRYMEMNYKDFVNTNSSIATKSIVTEAWNVATLIKSLLIIFGEVFVIIFIYSIMLYVNYNITFFLTLFLVLNVFLLNKTVSNKIEKLGVDRESQHKSFYKIINSTLGNFKIINIQSNYKKVLKKFEDVSYEFSKTNIYSSLFSNIPKLFIEAMGFGLVVLGVVFIVWNKETDISSYLPLITVFILGLYRMLPSVNKIIVAYNSILFNLRSLDIIYDDLTLEVESLGVDKVVFNSEITLNNISFSYNDSVDILMDSNMTILKGDKIGIIGESGSGKSTLVDIIIGLYKPTKGNICVDNTPLSNKNVNDFRKKIGYIPQDIYLFDGTIAENIVSEFSYNKKRIEKVLSQANILDFLNDNCDGIYTKVGENGTKLSGGQKQRVAIARALYNDPEILVLDEATSALDNKTEEKIVDEIYNISQNKTLIVVSHRLSTMKSIDKIYTIKNRRVEKT